ncbi:MAG TPA: hypothetical protein PK264_12950 [Hyphomicrobiaceae bacterium]|nr:hypothetical protein [Hyphomicrobiaceae bacterium]
MLTPKILGALVVFVPAALFALVALRRYRPVFYFAMILIGVATGYLWATGATERIWTETARYLPASVTAAVK